MSQPGQRLLILDGLRGAAAIGVLLTHGSFLIGPVLPRGFLSVDFFFLLSGLILERRFGESLRAGLSLRDFMRERLARLYPVYSIGVAFGFGVACLYSDGSALALTELAAAAILSLLFLPVPTLGGWTAAWVILPPGWSLFFELAVNAFYAGLARVLTRRAICCLIGVGATLLFDEVREWGALNVGWNMATIDGGVGRVLFSFFAGVYIGRYCAGKTAPVPSNAIPMALVGALLFFLALPRFEGLSGYVGLAIVVLAWPVLAIIALRYTPTGLTARLCRALGCLSYPLYCLHFPLLSLVYLKLPEIPVERRGAHEAMYLCLLAGPVILACAVGYWDEARRRADAERRARPGSAQAGGGISVAAAVSQPEFAAGS